MLDRWTTTGAEIISAITRWGESISSPCPHCHLFNVWMLCGLCHFPMPGVKPILKKSQKWSRFAEHVPKMFRSCSENSHLHHSSCAVDPAKPQIWPQRTLPPFLDWYFLSKIWNCVISLFWLNFSHCDF